MTDTPRFRMLGDPEALVCEDGVCAVPEALDDHEAATAAEYPRWDSNPH